MLKRFFNEEAGQGMVEYGLIIALIAVVLIGALVAMNGGLKTIFGNISNTLNNPNSATWSLRKSKDVKIMFKRFFNEESGQGMVEYGLIIALIAVVLIGALVAMNGGLNNIFKSTANALNNPNSATWFYYLF